MSVAPSPLAFLAPITQGELPDWAHRARLAVDLRVGEVSPTATALAKLTAQEYKAFRGRWRNLLLASKVPRGLALQRVGFVVVRVTPHAARWDSAVGGLKPLLDCLMPTGTAYPDGLHVIEGAMPSNMPIGVHLVQRLVPTHEPHGTLVQIYDLT